MSTHKHRLKNNLASDDDSSSKNTSNIKKQEIMDLLKFTCLMVTPSGKDLHEIIDKGYVNKITRMFKRDIYLSIEALPETKFLVIIFSQLAHSSI